MVSEYFLCDCNEVIGGGWCPSHSLCCAGLQKSKKLKLAKELSDIVIYCKSVHFHGFEDAKENLAFYEMSSFKEGKAVELAEESGNKLVLTVSHKAMI